MTLIQSHVSRIRPVKLSPLCVKGRWFHQTTLETSRCEEYKTRIALVVYMILQSYSTASFFFTPVYMLPFVPRLLLAYRRRQRSQEMGKMDRENYRPPNAVTTTMKLNKDGQR